MSKKIATLVAAILISLLLPIGAAAAPAIEIYINQEKVVSDVAPLLEQGRVLVPLRVISEHFGAKVHWDDKIKTAKVQLGSKLIQLAVNDTKAYIDGQDVTLDVPAKIVNDRTVVPLRFIGEALGADVYWDDAQKKVVITKKSINVTKIEYNSSSGMPAIVIEGDYPLEYTTWVPEGSDQLVIDIKASLAVTNNAIYVYDDFVDKVVAGQTSQNPDAVRLVVDLHKMAGYREVTHNDGKTIEIQFINTLNSVNVESEEERLTVNLDTTMSTSIKSSFLSNPDRLVIDIDNAVLLAENPDIPDNDFVKGIRVGQFSKSPDIARVVFDLKDNSHYQVFQTKDSVSIIFSQVSAISGLEVMREGPSSIVKFDSDSDIGYEIKSDKEKKQIRVTVPGIAFGKDFPDKVDIKDGIIDKVEVIKSKDQNNYNAEIIITLYSFSGYELVTTPPSKGMELVVFESALQNKIIVIDPGHGGSDPGAMVGKVDEKSLNLGIALKLRDLLQAQGAKVIMIRDNDIAVDLYVRAGIANQAGADAFISIHHNSAARNTVTGTETWYYPDPDKKAFTQAVHKAVIGEIGAADRGIKESVGLVVTRETRMPSSLVEVAFLTNPQDLAKAQTPEYQQKVAWGIYQGIMNYFSGR